METLILSSDNEDIRTAANIIKAGGIVAMPTETVYGLAADALNGKAVRKIFRRFCPEILHPDFLRPKTP